jgi:tetratricopeptide (TPR) repeat protein
MSKESDQALAFIASGRLDEAYRLASSAVQHDPSDWHAHYVFGQCFRFAQDYPKACTALSLANELEPRQPSVLLALGVARQLNDEYAAAIDALRLALEIDPDFAAAYNTLAMTQKLMGANENAAHIYDEGAKALARAIAKSLRNEEDSPRHPHWRSRTDLWTQYALIGALYLSAHASVDHLAWPTGEMAERDARTQEFRGWYWQDRLDAERKVIRLFLPNYFNTFCVRLRTDALYANLVGNRSTVLRLMGNIEEADQHLKEAEDFLPPTAGHR